MRRLLFFVLFITSLSVGAMLNQMGRYRDVFRSICDLTQDHFYKVDRRLENWLQACHQKARQLSWRVSADELLRQIQDHMNELQVSHFQIYDPNEDKRLWTGESVDTGIRARYVEDLLIVYKVEAGSAAMEAGIKAGDEIVSLPGSEQVTPWGAMRRAGPFGIKRRGLEMKMTIAPRSLQVDSAPKLQTLSNDTALLVLDSFRAEYFRKEAWLEMARRLEKYPHVIIDLRENAGGSFVAMLRALSTFHCEGKWVGTLVQPRKALAKKDRFDDNDSDLHQIQELEKYHSLGLKTFAGYGCFRGQATVLMGPDTSSVAEIFAHSFLKRSRSRVWGQPTAGDVILAVWYDLPLLGEGYSASVPEAVYLTEDKKELEGIGVTPQKELYYDLRISLLGKDSWVERALNDRCCWL